MSPRTNPTNRRSSEIISEFLSSSCDVITTRIFMSRQKSTVRSRTSRLQYGMLILSLHVAVSIIESRGGFYFIFDLWHFKLCMQYCSKRVLSVRKSPQAISVESTMIKRVSSAPNPAIANSSGFKAFAAAPAIVPSLKSTVALGISTRLTERHHFQYLPHFAYLLRCALC